jgi:enoyl-[acyl-carrier-protein] reductase (NADH)
MTWRISDRSARHARCGGSPRIADIAAVATFLASDAAQAIAGTWINATAGRFPS